MTTRSAKRRAELTAKGWAQKNWLLPPQALADLRKIVEREECSETAAVERALAGRAREANAGTMTNAQLLKQIGRRLRPD